MKLVIYLDRVMAVVAALLVATTAIITCVAVFFRSVVGASLPWPEEISGNLLVWTSFAGAYIAARTHGHIAFDLVVDKVPLKLRKILLTANDLMLCMFFGLLFWLSWQAISVVGGSSLETVPLPKGLFMAAIPFGAGTLIIAILAGTYERWKGVKEGAEQWSE